MPVSHPEVHNSGPGSPPARPGLALAVIALAQLMVVLDATIVNVALPDIQHDLKFSTAGLAWVVGGYTLTFGGLLLLGGRAGDILGRRRVFLAGLAIFSAASLVGGMAQGGGLLLAARTVQGVGAAIVAPSVLALISTTFTEERERNRAFGVFAGVSGAGAALGLMAGGVLTEWLSWRWVLFVNVPIGLALIALTPRFVPDALGQPGRFDVAGALTSTGGMGALVYGFIRAGQDGWSDQLTLVAFVVAAVLLALFIAIEARSAQPIMPLRMFADRNRASIYLINLPLTGALLGLFFFLTLYLQNVLQYRPLQAGLAFLPLSVSIIVTASQVSRYLPRIGQKPPMVAGMVLNTAALLWLSQLSTGSGYVDGLLGPMLMFGVGVGLIFVPLTMIGVSGVPMEEAGAASSVLQATQQVGGALGLAILITAYGTATRNGIGDPSAVLTRGITRSLLIASIFYAVGLLLAVLVIRTPPIPAMPAGFPGADPSEAGAGGAASPEAADGASPAKAARATSRADS